MEQLAKAGHGRQTFWLEMALGIGAIGWGIYVLAWFHPINAIKGMPDGTGWSAGSTWGVAAIAIGFAQCTTYWRGPSRIITFFGAALWACVAGMFANVNTHALSNYLYAYVCALHLALVARFSRTLLLNAWVTLVEAIRESTPQDRDGR